MNGEHMADYRLVRLLGEGGQGRVYLAETPPRLGVGSERVALKALARRGSDEEFHRVVEELKRAASTRSPYLTPLYEAGLQGGRLYYSMEYHPLGTLASPASPLEPDGILRAVRNAARGAHALHEVGTAHRAIKPANVLVHEEGGHLSDVGLTQILSPGQTVSGLASIDSIEFLEPGVMRGEKASRASDIWALGAVLHRAMSGSSVYPETPTDLLSALRQVLSSQPQVDGALEPEVARLVRDCLAAEPADRPPTAEAVAARVDALVGGSR